MYYLYSRGIEVLIALLPLKIHLTSPKSNFYVKYIYIQQQTLFSSRLL